MLLNCLHWYKRNLIEMQKKKKKNEAWWATTTHEISMFTTVFDQHIVYIFSVFLFFCTLFFCHTKSRNWDWLMLIFVVPFIQQVVIFYIDFFLFIYLHNVMYVKNVDHFFLSHICEIIHYIFKLQIYTYVLIKKCCILFYVIL